jgi:hypothetical protein
MIRSAPRDVLQPGLPASAGPAEARYPSSIAIATARLCGRIAVALPVPRWHNHDQLTNFAAF